MEFEEFDSQYEERGYFVVRNIISSDSVQAVRSEISRIIDEDAKGYHLDRSRVDGVELKGQDAVRAVADSSACSRVLWEEWLTSEKVLEINRHFIGENVRVQGTRFFTKPARVGDAAPWHQDIWLWARDPAKGTREHKNRHLSCWVALEKVDLENGCLHLMPGTHHGDVIEHIQYDDALHPEIPKNLVAERTPDPVPLGPGDAVVWHANMWHMSPPNTSDRTRWGGVMVTLPDEMAEGAQQADRAFIIRDGKALEWPGHSC